MEMDSSERGMASGRRKCFSLQTAYDTHAAALMLLVCVADWAMLLHVMSVRVTKKVDK